MDTKGTDLMYDMKEYLSEELKKYENLPVVVIGMDTSKKIPSLEEIKQAAFQDYDNQTKYDNAYDRQKGFVEGAKWVIKWMEKNKK
jgi:hypothetical protein